jgi:orotate phosphoribosyltransferase
MIKKDEAAVKIAQFLLQIKAIKLEPAHPFTWASGWKSPIYCDNRIALSYPKIRTYIRQQLAKAIEEKYGKPDVIAGVATAAIAQGVLTAEALGLPFVYVRPAAKDHGRNNQIEGEIKEGQKVVVIEDLISTGQSSLKAVEALRQAGCDVKGMAAIFTYGFEIAETNFREASCPCIALSNYDTLIHIATQEGYIAEKDITALKAWRENPAKWEKAEV